MSRRGITGTAGDGGEAGACEGQPAIESGRGTGSDGDYQDSDSPNRNHFDSMGRGKVKLELIEKPAERRDTLRRRGDGLRKKARELATLCGVDVCVVAYGGDQGGPSPAARVVERFRSMPEVDQCRKMLDGASLLRERVAKLQQQVRQAEIGSREQETKLLLHEAIAGRRPGLQGLTIQQLVSVGWIAEDRVKKIKERIAQLRGQQQQNVLVQPAPPPPYDTAAADVYSPPAYDTPAVDVDSPPPALTTAFNMGSSPPQGWLMEVLKD